jgi:Asp-tRNA(Asn)/Glu-tRNA(Gln) amidotransferase A subunit family amidase
MDTDLTRREMLVSAAAAAGVAGMPGISWAQAANGLALSWDEWARHDALALAALVRRRDVTPRELARQAAAAIAALNPQLNAAIEVFADRVDALEESSLGDGPLRGVPFAWKDLGAGERGRLQAQGSRLLADFRLPYDSDLAQRVKRAGLNPLARTTCPEFGFTLVTESTLSGVTRNPWSLAHTPGGSSGGSAALVAAGALPMAHTNDGGGSTRIPASFCGNIGLKTSRGMVSLAPDADHLLTPITSELVNTRSVRDTAAALDAMFGASPGEPFPFAKPERPFLAEVGAPPGRLRIVVSTGAWGPIAPAPAIAAETKRVAKWLESLGHHVEEGTPPLDFAAYLNAFITFWVAGTGAQIAGLEVALGRKAGPDNLEPIVWLAAQAARSIGAIDYLGAQAVQAATSRALGAFFETCDVLLTPTVAQPTPRVGSALNLLQTDVSLETWFGPVMAMVPYTPLCNFTGVPAISLPLAQLGELPLGMHFIAPMGEDARLIRLAAQLEAAGPKRTRVPPVHVIAI